MRVGAVVLAAGESSRMGRPKMLLPWGRGTVLSAVVSSLLSAPLWRVVVVLGHRAAEVGGALEPVGPDPRLRVVVNDRYPEGMLTSIQRGARELPGSAVLVALGDQPLVTPGTVKAVIRAHEGGITVPVHGGRRGHPVLVDASLVGDLLTLPPEAGLRGLFMDHPKRVTYAEVCSEEILIDLDTPADYLAHGRTAHGLS